MRKATVLYKGEEAGTLIQHDDGSFTFRYNDSWLVDTQKPAISLTLPKNRQEYYSPYLFPFFFNMLPEGSNKQFVCKHLRIDADDAFGLLMNTAQYDAIGAISIRKIA